MIHPAYFETRFRVDTLPSEWPPRFAILSAWATTGQIWTTEANDAADRRLSARLASAGLWHWRLTGYSPTTAHAEPSWACGLDWDEACDWGQAFRQDAIYYVSGDDLSVSHCDDRRRLLPVGRFRQRLDWDLTPFL